MKPFESLGIIPVGSAVLKTYLNHLHYPQNKISDLEKNGELIRLKKDLYVNKCESLSKELIANHLYGVSYVSRETALAFYGMIPERVYSVSSMTEKRAKSFTTPLGNFTYKTVPSDYFHIGIRQEVIAGQYAFLIAEQTKAVCDMIATTPNLRLQSVGAMRCYLTEDLRIDMDELKKLDTGIVTQCVKTGKKMTKLGWLLKFLKEEQGIGT